MRTLPTAPSPLSRLAEMARDVGDEETAQWYGGATGTGTGTGRRRRLAGLVVAALVLVACGGDPAPRAGPDSERDPSLAEEATSSAAFPVTIDHKFGATDITEEPERVLSLGYQEHDTVFALGVDPIAVRYWFGDEDDVIFPWAEEAAGDADPEILNMAFGELNYEKIAALRPDVILGLYSGISEDEYEKLSAIAPTVAQTDEHVDFGAPWQEATRTIGSVLGRAEQAEELVAEVESRFEAVRDAHPTWDGLSLVVASYGADGLGAFTSQDLRSRFFTSLGFEVPGEIDDIAGELFYATLSFEQSDLLDTDVLVWDQVNFTEGGRATVEADPLIKRLDVTQDGRVVFIGPFEDAFAWSSVLSLPVALDGLVPMLEWATDGDPATTPSPAS